MTLNADADPTNDVDVMSMSFGEQRSWGSCATDPLHTAVCNAYAAGIIMVAGAGNSSVDAGSFVPAAFDEVISVSALADFDATRGSLAGCFFVADLFATECDDTFAFFKLRAVVRRDRPRRGGLLDHEGQWLRHPEWDEHGDTTRQRGGRTAWPPRCRACRPPRPWRFCARPGNVRMAAHRSGDGTCAGQGTWTDDPDGVAEPLVNALRAAQGGGVRRHPPPSPARRR